ncbi:hypothetical protein AX16_010393 [Volvariella volvacea WC 439]|nr:hypothetical protein AX16_010393 [Volvariella volvacea WC 439]
MVSRGAPKTNLQLQQTSEFSENSPIVSNVDNIDGISDGKDVLLLDTLFKIHIRRWPFAPAEARLLTRVLVPDFPILGAQDRDYDNAQKFVVLAISPLVPAVRHALMAGGIVSNALAKCAQFVGFFKPMSKDEPTCNSDMMDDVKKNGK